MCGSRPEQATEIVRLAGIRKAFGKVTALSDVSLSLCRGETHALLGENGAGKSTLMNLLFGMFPADAGKIWLDGVDVTRGWSTKKAIAAGIGMIHQHFSLVGEHTVLENVVMPTLRWSELALDWTKHRVRLAGICAEYGMTVDPDATVETLSVGERQQVEILKMLFQGARILILDEPTSVLTPQQADALLRTLERFREHGYAVVIITHKLADAMRVCDRITVLRHGCRAGTVRPADASVEEVARLMVVQDIVAVSRRKGSPDDAVALEARDVVVAGDGRPAVDGLHLRLRRGEVLGIAGVAGNGQVELAEALVGLRPMERGNVLLGGLDISGASNRERRARGLSFVPEDRHAMAMIGDMDVAENMVLQRVGEAAFARLGVLNRRALVDNALRYISEFDIRVHSPSARMGTLSGGNQQKVVIARELSANPGAIVVCEPARGLDFSAAAYVRDRLLASAEGGVGVLLISSDLDELLALSHRIIVMYRGRIIGEVDAGACDIERIGLMMAGVSPDTPPAGVRRSGRAAAGGHA